MRINKQSGGKVKKKKEKEGSKSKHCKTERNRFFFLLLDAILNNNFINMV